MKKLMILAIWVFSSTAVADGFVCETYEGDLRIKVFNHVQPNNGTRNVSTMVISDQSVQEGRRTVAVFTDLNKTLDNQGAFYSARVDMRFSESARGGEYLLGTRLMYVSDIILAVDFSYGAPMLEGSQTTAFLTLVKRDNAGMIHEKLVCTRYLK